MTSLHSSGDKRDKRDKRPQYQWLQPVASAVALVGVLAGTMGCGQASPTETEQLVAVGQNRAWQCPLQGEAVPPAPGNSTFLVRSASAVPRDSDVGALRVSCDYSHMNNDDPLLSPAQPGRTYLHTYFGNTGTNANSNYANLRGTGDSTCRGGIANRSAYWIPTLLAGNAPLVPANMVVFYKAGYGIPNASPQVQRIPAGLRGIAGEGSSTEASPALRARWGCLNSFQGQHGHIVDCPVGDSIQLSVYFPQCWNGVDLDSADHRSHLAYPEHETCPASHPVILPEMSMHVRWERTNDLDVASLRLASDCNPELPAGYSAHAGWFEAWDPEIRDTFVTRCINPVMDCYTQLLGDGRELY